MGLPIGCMNFIVVDYYKEMVSLLGGGGGGKRKVLIYYYKEMVSLDAVIHDW